MRLGFAGGALAVIAVILLIVGYSSLFQVYQTRQALVVRLGDPVRVVDKPGLHVKIPLIDTVIYVDKRILDLENSSQEVIAADQKQLIVDAFARYKVVNPLKFYQTVGTVEGANSRLAPFLNSALRAALGEATLTQVVREQREQLMARVREQLDQNSNAVYTRMKTEREREAQEFRSQGTQKAQEIRAKADRDATVIVAEATNKAEQTRGEGDAERNRIFADAFNRDPDFFAFYRSMQAYEAGLQQGDTRFLVRPDSEFFRYFLDPNGKQRPDTAPSAPPPPAPGAPR
jgi:membrane protease subunit HflC